MSIWLVALVGAGGAIGTAVRFGVGRWVARNGVKAVWGTLAVNMAGSFAAGALVGLQLGTRAPAIYAFAAPGILGGLTTYSTLNVQKAQLAGGGNRALLAKYVAASYIGGALCTACGFALGSLFSI